MNGIEIVSKSKIVLDKCIKLCYITNNSQEGFYKVKNNVLKFPKTTDGDLVFDFGEIDSQTLDKVFDVMNLLSNQVALVEKFTPDVRGFLDKEEYFENTVFKAEYDQEFENFVLGLIKAEIVSHFNFTPEEVLILTDRDFVDLLTDGYYFNKENYKGAKDGEHSDSVH